MYHYRCNPSSPDLVMAARPWVTRYFIRDRYTAPFWDFNSNLTPAQIAAFLEKDAGTDYSSILQTLRPRRHERVHCATQRPVRCSCGRFNPTACHNSLGT